MATALADRPTTPAFDRSTVRPAPVAAGPRRNRSRIALGTLIVVLCVLASMVLYSRADDRVQAISLRRTVNPGEQLTAGDLSTVSVNADSGLPILSPADAKLAIGRTATATLPTGTLLSLGQLADDAGLPPGTEIVGAVLSPGQSPIGLAIADTVRIIATPPAASTESDVAELGTGSVLAIEDGGRSGDDLVVSLAVPKDVAAEVAGAGADGRLVLIVVPAP